MAATTKSSVSVSVPQVWEARLYSQAEALTIWNKFEGDEGSSMPVIRKDDLTKDAGDTIKYDIVLALAGTGTQGDTVLTEGNEEVLKFRQISLTVNSLKHAVRWTELAEALITHDMRTSALNQLRKWLAGKFEQQIFAEFTGMTVGPFTGGTTLPTTAQWFAGSATSIGAIANTGPASAGALSGGTMTLRDISELKAYLVSNNLVEPMVMSDGQEIFGLICHPYSILSLKTLDTQWAQAQRDANLRGPDNAVFTGAVGMWDGVVIYPSLRVPAALDGASSIQVARNVFVGAQALCRGYAMYPKWIEEEFSYGEEAGIATRAIMGVKMNAFDLTSAGGASAANFTAIGHAVYYAAAVAPTA